MKNYKLLAPVVLIGLFVLGIYMTASNNVKAENQFEQYLADARDFAAQEIEVYARENYQNALNMRPSLELYLEIAAFYRDTMQSYDGAVEWGDALLRIYPKEPKAYEFMLGVFLEHYDYIAFFELYHDMVNRHVVSEAAEALYQSVEYEYYLQGEYDEVSIFSGNMASIRRNETWGYSDSRGKKALDTIYTYAGAFNNGMAPVIDAEGKAYFIDSEGNKILVPKVSDADVVTELGVMSSVGLYALNNGKEWNYYNQSGDMIMGGFTEITTIAYGLAACKNTDGWKIYDAAGNVQGEITCDEVLTDEIGMACGNERFFVRTGDSCWMVDTTGAKIGTDTYEDAKVFYENTYAAAEKGGKWGFIDKDGNWFVEPVYEDARSFSNGYAAVKMDGLWGFINMNKELCIPCQFTDAKDFTANGTVFVQNNMAWSVLLLYQKNY